MQRRLPRWEAAKLCTYRAQCSLGMSEAGWRWNNRGSGRTRPPRAGSQHSALTYCATREPGLLPTWCVVRPSNSPSKADHFKDGSHFHRKNPVVQEKQNTFLMGGGKGHGWWWALWGLEEGSRSSRSKILWFPDHKNRWETVAITGGSDSTVSQNERLLSWFRLNGSKWLNCVIDRRCLLKHCIYLQWIVLRTICVTTQITFEMIHGSLWQKLWLLIGFLRSVLNCSKMKGQKNQFKSQSIS